MSRNPTKSHRAGWWKPTSRGCGVLAALLVFVFVTRDGLLGVLAQPAEAALALLLAGTVVAQPATIRLLRRVVAWPEFGHATAVAGVIILALFLRLWGLRFGLPYRDHPDEWAVADRALQMLRTADYSPHAFIYPPLYTYLQLGVAALHFLWGVGARHYRTLADIDPARYYVWARTLTALLGTGAVLVVYVLGRQIYGRAAGLLAALLLTVYPAAVGDAHYVTTDTPAMFFTVLAFLLIARLGLQPPTHRRDRVALALIAGLGDGLAVATKYTVVVLALPLLLAVLMAEAPASAIGDSMTRAPGERDPFRMLFPLWLACLGLLLGFTLGAPVWLRELPQMLNDIASVIVHYTFVGHPGAESSHPAFWYWDAFLANGALLACLFLIGTFVAFVRRSRGDLLMLSFVVPAVLELTGVKVVFFRNVMPLLPFLCLLAAAVIVTAHDWLRPAGVYLAQRVTVARFWRPQIGALLVSAIFVAQPLAQALSDDWLRALPTTRLLATDWIAQHAQDGMRIWLEDQTLILSARLRVQGGLPISTHGLDWYRRNQFRYLVINADAKRTDRGQLAAFGAPAARFPPEGRLGPTLAIYDTGVGDPAQDARSPSGATLGADAVELDGYQHPTEATPGMVLPLALYWRAKRSLGHAYTVYVHLLDATGTTVAQRDVPPLDGSRPTTQWKPGDLIRDDQDLTLPKTLHAGTYMLVVGMYDPTTQAEINDTGPIAIGAVVIR